jgi:fructose-1-phosphate kinase PfkB-like protein
MRFITLTANLLAETTYTYDAWSEGATQRAREEYFQVGGKGINVARMLRRLEQDAVALWFPGGISGERCRRWLEQREVPHVPFPVTAETRTGAVVRAPGRAETTFLGAENVIDADAIAACAAWLDARAGGELLSIGGSIPEWDQAKWDPLRHACERWTARSPLVVDTYGSPLAWFTARPAALVKINRKEFAGLAGVATREATDERMPELLHRVARSAAIERWVITDGPHLVWSRERDGRVTAVAPPPVAEVSPTGSGDVFLAGLLFALHVRGLDLAAAVDFALPLGAANAAAPYVADFDLAPWGLADAGEGSSR